jgi:hypothetical protein
MKDLASSEPTVPQLEHLFNSLLVLYQKLQELGFAYYNGKVSIIDEKEAKNRCHTFGCGTKV